MKKMVHKILSYRPTFEVSVGVVLFLLREGKPQFLLLQYPHGHWDFVKGHKEKNETDEETLKRELLEETGISQANIVPDFTKVVRFRYTAKGTEKDKRQDKGNGLFVRKKVIYYAAQTTVTRVEQCDEHYDWAWLTYEDAVRKITHKNSRDVLVSFMELFDTMHKKEYS